MCIPHILIDSNVILLQTRLQHQIPSPTFTRATNARGEREKKIAFHALTIKFYIKTFKTIYRDRGNLHNDPVEKKICLSKKCVPSIFKIDRFCFYLNINLHRSIYQLSKLYFLSMNYDDTHHYYSPSVTVQTSVNLQMWGL